jgi:sortase A
MVMGSNKRNKLGSALIASGLLLCLAAGLLLGYNLWDDQRAKASSADILRQFPQQAVTLDAAPSSASVEQSLIQADEGTEAADEEPATVEIDGRAYLGRLDIPALGLSLPVLDSWSYSGLKLAPCRYSGSGADGDLVIAGHNYESHFGALKSLRVGDQILLTDGDGSQIVYEVAALEQLEPTDVDQMTAGDWPLTLFTCTMSGTARITVRCILST